MIVAFVGASGYGNVGDDTYPYLLKRHLAGHELRFFNSDLPKTMPPVDMVVVGGGGVVYNNSDNPSTDTSAHFRKMRFYMEHALKQGIPLGFLSCGFQFRPDFEEERQLETLPLWKPYLEAALFASFRSRHCLDVFREVTGRTDGCYFPDLGYLNYHQRGCAPQRSLPARYAVVVPTGSVQPGDEYVRRQVRLLRAAGCQAVWVQMGADCDDKEHMDEAAELDPDLITVRGASCAEISAIIAGASFVISGRYHGMVFARTNGVPFYVPPASPYKVRMEDWDACPADAFGHIELIGGHLRAAARPPEPELEPAVPTVVPPLAALV
jgi:hypothetical protein